MNPEVQDAKKSVYCTIHLENSKNTLIVTRHFVRTR
jgi:hypothetical protein